MYFFVSILGVNILEKLIAEEGLEYQISVTVKSLLSHEEASKVEKSKDDLRMDGLCFEYIQDYVSKHSTKKSPLELALQTYKEWHNELKNIAALSN